MGEGKVMISDFEHEIATVAYCTMEEDDTKEIPCRQGMFFFYGMIGRNGWTDGWTTMNWLTDEDRM